MILMDLDIEEEVQTVEAQFMEILNHLATMIHIVIMTAMDHLEDLLVNQDLTALYILLMDQIHLMAAQIA